MAPSGAAWGANASPRERAAAGGSSDREELGGAARPNAVTRYLSSGWRAFALMLSVAQAGPTKNVDEPAAAASFVRRSRSYVARGEKGIGKG